MKRRLKIILTIIIMMIAVGLVVTLYNKSIYPTEENIKVFDKDSVQDPEVITDVRISKSHVDIARVGEEINVTIDIDNLGDETVDLKIMNTHTHGVKYIDAGEIKYHHMGGLKLPYSEWETMLEPNSSEEVKYLIRFDYPIAYETLNKIEAYDQYGNKFTSGVTRIRIID